MGGVRARVGFFWQKAKGNACALIVVVVVGACELAVV